MSKRPRVIIVGGGFGGLYAAKALKNEAVDLTIIDRRNYHLFQPLLYQVATAGLSPGDIAAPLRGILARQLNARVLMAEVTAVDARAQTVTLAEGETLAYDYLIVATGVSHSYFGQTQWEQVAPGLKCIDDALEIRRRVLIAYEAAERAGAPDEVAGYLTFAVVGAGPTGVELAGALAELAQHTLRNDFRSIDPTRARVLLLEAGERVLPMYPPALSASAEESLARLGVTVRTQTKVVAMAEGELTVEAGGVRETIPTHTVLWAAGVQGSPLGKLLAAESGAPTDRAGRLMVNPDCSAGNFPNLFVIGDLAHFAHGTAQPLPGVAPVAMQQGEYVARVIRRVLRGLSKPEPFAYWDRGSMATIGRAAAVAMIGPLRFSGYPAWLAWLFVHLLFLVGFDNRIMVMIRWTWNYWSYARGVRLITGDDAPRAPVKTPSLPSPGV
jgi:NADH:ubiquinone reductase (H+-translocating)